MHRTFCAAFFGSALLVSFSVRPVSAQVLYGSAVGTVQDPTGGTVAEAPVTMTNKATGAVRETKTDQQGRFSFANLLPGGYDLKVTARRIPRVCANRDRDFDQQRDARGSQTRARATD